MRKNRAETMKKAAAVWVRRARSATGLTQRQFAEAVGADVTSVSGWERGRIPSPAFRSRIVRVSGVEPPEGLEVPNGLAEAERVLIGAVRQYVAEVVRDEIRKAH